MKLIQILLQVEKAIVASKFTVPVLPAIAFWGLIAIMLAFVKLNSYNSTLTYLFQIKLQFLLFTNE